MVTKALRALAAWAVLLVSCYAHSAVYRMQFVGGDTVGLSTLNDAGTLVMVGFGDRGECPFGGARGRSAILPPPYIPIPTWQFVDGPPGVEPRDCGVDVRGLNSAGDMIGTSFRDGVEVPTFWRDGIAYDLRDPANSGLTFVPDPGVQRVAFDFASLDIINISDFPFIGPPADWETRIPHTALTNAGGLLAFTLNMELSPVALLIPVSEPPLIALVMLGALVAARYVKRSNPGSIRLKEPDVAKKLGSD